MALVSSSTLAQIHSILILQSFGQSLLQMFLYSMCVNAQCCRGGGGGVLPQLKFRPSESASVAIRGYHNHIKSMASSYPVCGIAMIYFTIDNLCFYQGNG